MITGGTDADAQSVRLYGKSTSINPQTPAFCGGLPCVVYYLKAYLQQ